MSRKVSIFRDDARACGLHSADRLRSAASSIEVPRGYEAPWCTRRFRPLMTSPTRRKRAGRGARPGGRRAWRPDHRAVGGRLARLQRRDLQNRLAHVRRHGRHHGHGRDSRSGERGHQGRHGTPLLPITSRLWWATPRHWHRRGERSPHDSITAYADEGGYDCIVMGHHGLAPCAACSAACVTRFCTRPTCLCSS